MNKRMKGSKRSGGDPSAALRYATAFNKDAVRARDIAHRVADPAVAGEIIKHLWVWLGRAKGHHVDARPQDYMLLAQALHSTQEYDCEIDYLERLTRLGQPLYNHKEALCALASIYIDRGQKDEAAPILYSLFAKGEKVNNDKIFHLKAANTLTNAGKPLLAAGLIQRRQGRGDIFFEYPPADCELAQAWNNAGKAATSIAYLEPLLEGETYLKGNKEAIYVLGLSYMYDKQRMKALLYFEKHTAPGGALAGTPKGLAAYRKAQEHVSADYVRKDARP